MARVNCRTAARVQSCTSSVCSVYNTATLVFFTRENSQVLMHPLSLPMLMLIMVAHLAPTHTTTRTFSSKGSILATRDLSMLSGVRTTMKSTNIAALLVHCCIAGALLKCSFDLILLVALPLATPRCMFEGALRLTCAAWLDRPACPQRCSP